jgi:hypothetical protein
METIKELQRIRLLLLHGAISYNQAKAEAKPHLEEFNTKAVEIAKKHKVKPRLINFASFMR